MDLKDTINHTYKAQNCLQKQQIYRFSGFFFSHLYVIKSKIQEICPAKSSFSSTYLHEAVEGMDTNVYYGDFDHCRKNRQTNATYRS